MTLVACGTGRRVAGGRGGGFGRRSGWALAGLAAAVLCAAPAVADEDDPERGLPGVLSGGEGLADSDPVGLALFGVDQPPLPGEEVVYQATVANGGETPVEGALLAQHVPEPLEVLEIDQGGLVEEGVANWRVDVPEGGEAVYTVRVRVSENAEAGVRVVSTACLLLDRDAEPSACASDTLLVADQTVLSRAGELVDRDGVLRAVGVGVLMVLVWLLWRQWGPARKA
ncbi:hypothetical protein NE857_23810 [Nocardiopsis exhalans]|uniref:DUF11 domain-containing protein n=1 Tax=Nocardiopsis exhalans TaxID=163604 RepID=A0ABY5D1U5_9ACTN|nr:hypothetical protein [Nocardiopsis exhalans]USY18319.1 hypothetical protein NE857_23810 [Nocardiopsis exhalans]